MHRVLIVTDNETLASKLTSSLVGRGVKVMHSGQGLDSIDTVLANGEPELIVVGSESESSPWILIKQIQQRNYLEDTPIFGILSQSNLESPHIQSLSDFALDTASVIETVARILFRLAKNSAMDGGDTVRVGGLEVDVDNYKAWVDARPLDLTYKEFELLRFLVTNRGRVFTREILLDRVWGCDYYGGARTVDVHIRRLRSKLGSQQSLIETVRNVGYRLSSEG